MEYAQVPTNLLIGDYSDAEILAIVKYQLLFSSLENVPTNKILNKFLTKKQQNLVKNYVADINLWVQKDIESVNKKRERNSRYYHKSKVSVNEQEKFQTSYQTSEGRPNILINKEEKLIDADSEIFLEQAKDKQTSIEFINSKDYKYIKDVYKQVYGISLARLTSEQLLVVKSWFEIVDNPQKIQLVLDYYKNQYVWDEDKKPAANWIFKSSTNFISVYDDMVKKNKSVFEILK